MTDPDSARTESARRYLITGVVRKYLHDPSLNLPELKMDSQRIVGLFESLGYQHVPMPPSPTANEIQRTLDEFCRAADRRADDFVVVYLAGHGDIATDGRGEHVLLASDYREDRREGSLTGSDLAEYMLSGTRVHRLLFMLDACFSGEGGRNFAAVAAAFSGDEDGHNPRDRHGIWYVTSARPKELAQPEVFTTAFVAAVQDLNNEQGRSPVTVPDVVDRINQREQPAGQHIEYGALRGSGTLAFFGMRSASQEWDRQLARRRTEMSEHFAKDVANFIGRRHARGVIVDWLNDSQDHRAAVVSGASGTGKSALLGWLAVASDPQRTNSADNDGGPRPDLGAFDVAIRARGLTEVGVIAGIAAAAEIPNITDETPRRIAAEALIAGLVNRVKPLVVLIDAIDEAAYPVELAGLLHRLVAERPRQIRLLLGGRQTSLDGIPKDKRIDVELDDAEYIDGDALTQLVRKRLGGVGGASVFDGAPTALIADVVQAIAVAAGNSYQVAGQLADAQAARLDLPDPDDAQWRDELPSEAGEAMAKELRSRLGDRTDRALELLRPLAYAKGDGLPWGSTWPAMAEALSGTAGKPDDLAELERDAASYVVRAGTLDGVQLYRPSHQSLADFLRENREAQADEQKIVTALRSRVRHHPDGTTDWASADAYVRVHLATHAAMADAIDSLAKDPQFLLAAEPAGLLAALDRTTSPTSRSAANAYRAALPTLRRHRPEEHAAYLGLAARYMRVDWLADLIPPHPRWRAVWAAWRQQRPHTQSSGHSPVSAVAAVVTDRLTVVAGRDDGTLLLSDGYTGAAIRSPIAAHEDAVTSLAVVGRGAGHAIVSGGEDSAVRVWDLQTGVQIGEAFTDHRQAVRAVAVITLNGDQFVVSGGDDETVRLSHLDTGRVAAKPFTHHRMAITALAIVAARPGQPPLVASADEDGWTLVWDLEKGAIRSRWHNPLPVRALAVAELGGKVAIVEAGDDRAIRVRNLGTGEQINVESKAHRKSVRAIAVIDVGGQSVVVSGDEDGVVRTSRLGNDIPSSDVLGAHEGEVRALSTVVYDGRPMVVSGGADMSVRTWDLDLRSHVSEPFVGHNWGINAVSISSIEHDPVVISAGRDGTVRFWDLVTGSPVGDPIAVKPPATIAVPATIDSRQAFITADDDRIIRVWNRATRAPIGVPYEGHVREVRINAVAVADLDGVQVVISAGTDGTVHVWDPMTGRQVGTPFRGHHPERVRALVTAVLDNATVVISAARDAVRVWDLGSRNPVGMPFTGHADGVVALATIEYGGRTVVASGGPTTSAVRSKPMDFTVRTWYLDDRTETAPPYDRHSSGIWAIATGKVGHEPVVISGGTDKAAYVWRLSDRQSLGYDRIVHTDWVRSIAVTANGDESVAISGSGDGDLTVWNLATGVDRFARHQHWVRSIGVLVVDGREVLISGSVDGEIRAWDLKTGQPELRAIVGHHPGLRALVAARLRNGHAVVVTAGDDKSVRMWDLTRPHGPAQIVGYHDDWVRALAVTEFGGRRIIVSAGGTDVRMWDVDTRAPVGEPYAQHRGRVRSLAASHLGKEPMIVSGSTDTTVHVWSPRTGVRNGEPFREHHHAVRAVATAMLGDRPIAISASDNDTVRAWYLDTKEPVGSNPAFASPEEIGAIVVAPTLPGQITWPDALRVVVGAGESVRTFRLAADVGWSEDMSIDVRSDVLAAASSGPDLVVGTKLGLVLLEVDR